MSIKRKDTLNFFAQLWESPGYIIVKGGDQLEALSLVALRFATMKPVSGELYCRATKRGRAVGDAFFVIEGA